MSSTHSSKSSNSLKFDLSRFSKKTKNDKKKPTIADILTYKKMIPSCIKEEEEERELLDFDDSVELELPNE